MIAGDAHDRTVHGQIGTTPRQLLDRRPLLRSGPSCGPLIPAALQAHEDERVAGIEPLVDEAHTSAEIGRSVVGLGLLDRLSGRRQRQAAQER